MARFPTKRVAIIGAGISGVATAAHLKNEGLGVTVFERSSVAPGPCYEGLMNNVATRLSETTLNPYPPGTPDFVSHSVLSEYIQDTARKTGVDNITILNARSGRASERRTIWEFDAVVVASGHYHAARVPDIPGLVEWKNRWPARVQHSKGYRKPNVFEGKNIVLVGASVSSTDIARELSHVAKQIYQVHRNGKFDIPASILPPNDEVILCTGYHFSLPFLRDLHSDSTPIHLAGDTILVTDGTQLHNLHKDIFYIPDPTLIFVGVPFHIATFTLFEFQAMVVAKVLSGKVELPDETTMRAEYGRRVAEKGLGKQFHSLMYKEVEYVDELLEWVNGDLEKQGQVKLAGIREPENILGLIC